ncbi:FxsB family cyclophane-forming radical SAM/SPASM peptide maturase [Actinocrispum sp. NPDC049592]|uniref:FxsB family cyclophane-forming radical SAM/SPASM peptide maturase n=1 Tax=Actinocrispum sp. NPDC049592 TaxID=3154835 RepID=UPI003418C007
MADEWPIGGLDVAALTVGGWRPHPFTQFVLKVHSRCDLACDYCYIYTLGDSTWASRPKVITPAVMRAAAGRIADHCSKHELAEVMVVLHGGEPLLAGPSVIREVAAVLRSALPGHTTLNLQIQTNGVTLDRSMLDLLLGLNIKVGVSLDGAQPQHDKHRRTARGTGSYEHTARALKLLSSPEYRAIFAGLLCVIDVDGDPVETYETLLSFSPPAVDFLLPHGNWTTPPPNRAVGDPRTPYADWLGEVFDRWYSAPRQETRVRLFEEIINLTLGGASVSEQVGLSPVACLVVDTDGSLEQVDALRSVGHGAADTGLTVFGNDFDDVLRHPAIVARQIGMAALPETCMDCPIRHICGGGHYAHRYRRGSGYRNPSVYCPDLTKLIGYVTGRLRADISELLETT